MTFLIKFRNSIFKEVRIVTIFLSFSELEGFGLPPVEAALCGNHVIGYTGESGKEYWKAPIFDEIFSGDLRNFSNKVINKVSKLNKNVNSYNTLLPHVSNLADKYSVEKEKLSLHKLIDKIKNF